MADEQVFVVAAGSTELCEVVKSADGMTLTIRSVANPARNVSLPSGAAEALIGALQQFISTPQPGPDTN